MVSIAVVNGWISVSEASVPGGDTEASDGTAAYRQLPDCSTMGLPSFFIVEYSFLAKQFT